MASPQCENGHTQIANEIIEVLCRTNLSGLHLRIILIVIRFTFGFKRKEHQLSIRFIAKALNSSPNRVSEALKKLIEANIIHRVREGNKNHQPQVIKFNKDYDTWIVEQSDTGKQSAPGKQSDVGKHISPIEVNSNSPLHVNKEIKEKEKLKKDSSPQNSETEKIQYAEFVQMKETEYQKLLKQYGEINTLAMIKKLNHYKGANGRKYKSDYHAILNWVVDEVIPKNGKDLKTLVIK